MRINPVPEVKKGFCFLMLGLIFLGFMFFDPFSALITAGFMLALFVISNKEFS